MRSGVLVCAFILISMSLPIFANSSLVAHWPLDQNAQDISGHDLDGMEVGSPGWSSEGQIDGCVVLDGVDDCIEITGYRGITGAGSRTCAAWIQTTEVGGEIITWGSEEGGGARWIIRVNEGGQLRAEVQGGNIIGTTLINDGNWHHVAVVLEDDGSPNIIEARLYVDGSVETISASVDEPVYTGGEQDVRIGMYGISQRYFNGLIDDVRIYDTALNEGQIQAIYANLTGTGTAADPYQISTPEELIAIGSNAGLMDKYFVLMNDIIFDPVNNPAHVFTEAPIAPYRDSSSPTFTGHFDGAGYSIVNLEIQGADGCIGLFGRIEGADRDQVFVENLTLVNPMISGGDSYIGALAGWIIGGKVDSCHVVGGSVNEPTASVIGGLLGAGDVVEVSHCTSSAEVTGIRSVGGLVGAMGSSAIYDSSSSGNVYGGGSGCMGGLVGWWWGLEMVDLPEDAEIGVFGCSATGNVISSGGECGGLMGYVTIGVFEDCSATGTVNGTSYVGGLIGAIKLNQGGTTSTEGPTTVSQCYASGDVEGNYNYVGGLIGQCQAILVKDCYAIGNVQSGIDYGHVGGLIGSGYGMDQCSRCFSTGLVQGGEISGGLIGDYGKTHLCFWDTETSQMTESSGGVGKTTAEMMSMETYRGWGDDVWVLDEGNDYPHLAWEGTVGILITDDDRMYSGGNGTPDNPYQISTVDDLITLGWYIQDWDQCFELTNDIVLDPENLNDPNVIYPNANFNKIGVRGLPFTGYLNGNGFSIANMTNKNIDESDNGLFGYIIGNGPDDIVVENLRIINPAFAGSSCHGGLAGCFESGRVQQCGVEGFSFSVLVNGNSQMSYYIGGLFGYVKNAVVARCYADRSTFNLGNTGSGDARGGLIGGMSLPACRVENCYATATFNCSASFNGSLVGEAWSSSHQLINCYAVSVFGYNSFAGIVGAGDAQKLYCYSGSPSDSWMKEQDHFNYWDFVGESRNGLNEIWRLCTDGLDYPRLSWEFARNGDFACGGGVGMPDLIALAESWLMVEALEPTAFNYSCDADADGEITLIDFAVLSENYGPSFEVSKNTLSFSAYKGGHNPANQSFTIVNSNFSHLDWSINVDSQPEWLSITPTSGSLDFMEFEDVIISIDITDLAGGQYSYPVIITDLSGNLSQTITVNLTVIGPKIYLSKTNMSFQGYEEGENPINQEFTLKNIGGGTLNWTIGSNDMPDWLIVSPNQGTLVQNEYDNLTVSVNTAGLEAGQYSHELEIIDPIASNNPQKILISLEVIGPQLSLPESTFSFRGYLSGENPSEQSLVITNMGGGTLAWNIEAVEIPDWLVIASTSGSLPRNDSSNVPLSVDISGLPIGLYSYAFEVTDPNATDSPQVVHIILTVGTSDLIVPDDFSTIQTAIDAVAEDGTVTVMPGTYYENIQFKGKDCVLTSTDPNDMNIVENTVIDGNALDTVVSFEGSETADCTIRGFTITNGATSGSSVLSGGGIYGAYTKATIEKCLITNNTSNNGGGGLRSYYGHIKDCIISNNDGGEFGGGFANCYGTISNCIIANNIASKNGGGFSSCRSTIENCLITGNSSGNVAGGLFRCDGIIKGCIISNNTAEVRGGGLYQCWESTTYGRPASILNCSIVGNNPGGIHDCSGAISNCIIWGNMGYQISSVVLTYSCIQDWTGGGEGNITTDPMFADTSSADPADWDLHLLAGSGCIDAGTNSPTGGLPATDFDRNPRPVDGNGDGTVTADMGAYEYQP